MRTENIDLKVAISVLDAIKAALKNRDYRPLTKADTLYYGNRKHFSKATVFTDSGYALNHKVCGYTVMLTHHLIETRYYSGKTAIVRDRETEKGQITLRWNARWAASP